jgi:hypothetical protein
MRIVGFALVLGALFAATHGVRATMYSTEGIMLVLLGTLCLVRFSGIRVATVFRAGFSRRAAEDEALTVIAGCRLARICALGMGLLSTFTGAALMLRHLNDPAHIAPGVSMAHATILYSLVAAAFYLAIQAGAERHRPECRDESILWSAFVGMLIAVLTPMALLGALTVAHGRPSSSATMAPSPPAAAAVHIQPAADTLAK